MQPELKCSRMRSCTASGSSEGLQIEPQIYGQLHPFATLWETCQGLKCLFKVRHGFPVGRACGSLLPCLTEIDNGLLPHLAAERVMR